MTWMWITNIALLLGGEINPETERQAAMDTTKGALKPLGAREAAIANSIGADRG
jgi:membrane protein